MCNTRSNVFLQSMKNNPLSVKKLMKNLILRTLRQLYAVSEIIILIRWVTPPPKVENLQFEYFFVFEEQWRKGWRQSKGDFFSTLSFPQLCVDEPDHYCLKTLTEDFLYFLNPNSSVTLSSACLSCVYTFCTLCLFHFIMMTLLFLC